MDTPDFFVGARLGGARIKAGISLEKAAKDTRIRVQRLREIEADDFSGFAHPTYSRLFLLDYAEYLGISPDEIRPLLPDRAGAAGGGFQYINALSREPVSPAVLMQSRRPKLIRIFIALGLVLLLAAVGLVTYFAVVKIKRVTGSAALSGKTVADEKPAASPSPAATGVPEPTPEPIAVENALPGMPEPPAPPQNGGTSEKPSRSSAP
jgi:cytoskeleton protein RodZ